MVAADPKSSRTKDARSPEVRAAARRQSLAVAGSAHAREDQAFVDAVSDWAEK